MEAIVHLRKWKVETLNTIVANVALNHGIVFKRKVFIKLNSRVEGYIEIEPHGTLEAIHWEWIEEDKVATLTPSEESIGVTGSITIYFDETVDPADAQSIDEITE